MIKSILTAAAILALATPAASANGNYKNTVVTKRVTPIVAVSPINARRAGVINRRNRVNLITPRVRIVTPGVKVAIAPNRVVKRKVAPVRNRRLVGRRF